jgi:phosphoribosylpyrophosphate synthetase
MSEYADSVNVPAETDGAPQTPDMIVADKFDDLLGTRPPEQTEETDEPIDEYEDDVQDTQEEETEEEVEVQAEPELYKVIIDGEEVEVSLDELQKGYSRQSDYTRKTQQLAQQRKEAEALQQDYAQRVQQLNQFAQQIQQQPDIPEPAWTADPQAWERLRHEDPVQFVLEKDAARDRQLARQERAQQMQYLQSEQQQLQQQQFAQHLETERQNLLELIPAWTDKETAKTEKAEIRKFAQEKFGLTEQDLSAAYDSRLVAILYSAWQANKTTSQAKQQLKKSPESTVKTAPKMGRNFVPTDEGASRLKKSMQRLQKSGKNQDAVAVFDALLR